MKLKISYLGGIENQEQGISLTGSSTLFQIIDKYGKTLYSLLIDAGFFQGSRDEKKLNEQIDKDIDLSKLDAILVTHAHLDHIGKIPVLVKNGFKGVIYMTPETFNLAKLNWFDSWKIFLEEMNKNSHFKKKMRDILTVVKLEEKLNSHRLKIYERKKIKDKQEKLLKRYKLSLKTAKNILEMNGIKEEKDINSCKNVNIPYTDKDIYKTINLVKLVDYNTIVKLSDNVEFKFYNAAHIEGSAMPYLVFKNEQRKEYRCLIAQDLGRFKNNPLEEKVTFPLKKLHYLQLETTYAGRIHPELQNSIDKLIEEISTHKGPILLPAFAIQRTQYILKLLLENFYKLGNRKIYLTSELAKQVNRVLLEANFEKYKYLMSSKLKFLQKKQNLTSKQLKKAIIVGSSGMLQGGSILKWVSMLVNNPNTKIIFVGYQGEGTRGREILNGKKFIIVDGKSIPVKCKVVSINGFSSHADTKDLLIFLGKFKRTRKKIYLALTHGGDNRYILENLVNKTRNLRRNYDVHIPLLKEQIEFTW